MFVDASAMTAMIAGEEDADELADILDRTAAPITSPIAVFETVAALCRKLQANAEKTAEIVEDFSKTAGVVTVPIGANELALALSAYARFGKGRGHPAQLNLGDCFAYAVAASHQVPILFKGDDFSKTDIPIAR